MTAPWSNTANNPSELGKRPEATPLVLEQMGAGTCDVKHVQAFVETYWMGDIIIQSPAGGFSNGRFQYWPEMKMSYANQGVDHVIWSKATDEVMAHGRVMRIRCDGELVHLAHWPNCGNISRVYPLWEPLPGIPNAPIPEWFYDSPPEQGVPEVPEHTVPEPGTLMLMLLGMVIIVIFRAALSK